MAWRKGKRNSCFRNLVELFILTTFLVWLRLPYAFGLEEHVWVRGISLVPLVGGMGLWLLKSRPYKVSIAVNKRLLIWVLLYFVLLGWEFGYALVAGKVDPLRIFGNGLSLALVIGFGSYLAIKGFRYQRYCFQAGIFVAGTVYVFTNVIFHFLHVGTPAQVLSSPVKASMLSLVGIQTWRVIFPLSRTLNSLAYLGGALVAGAWPLFYFRRSVMQVGLGIVALLFGMLAVLLCDARAALGVVVLSSAIVLIALFLKKDFSFWVLLVSFVLPYVVVSVLHLLPATWTAMLSRNAGDLFTLSNRTVIWETVFSVARHDGVFHNLLGWGYRGQVTSGAIDRYIFLFQRYQTSVVGKGVTVHNSFLQAFMDSGIVGMGVLFALLLKNLSMLYEEMRNRQSMWAGVLYSSLTFLTMASAFDAVLSPDLKETFILFLLILISQFTTSNAFLYATSIGDE